MASSFTQFPMGDVERRFGLRSGPLFLLGILLITLGVLALIGSVAATVATVVAVGVWLLLGAIALCAAAFWARRWGGFFLFVLLAILYFVCGAVMIAHPIAAAEVFTLMLAAAFMIGGLFRVVSALIERYEGWVWVLLSGVIGILLGLAIWNEWPESGLWVIGLFVGIDMIFIGWSAIAYAMLPHSPEMR